MSHDILIKSTKSNLPDFKNPPVVETVLGVQFNALEGLTNSNLMKYWADRQNDWPSVKNVPPLDEQFEQFGEASLSWNFPVPRLQISQELDSRIMLTHREKDRIIQIQNNRIHFNWTGGHQDKQYPRYRALVRPEFEDVFKDFSQFVTDKELGEIVPNQWEVTYVNHIPKGTVWDTPDDWATLFSTSPALRSPGSGLSLEGLQAEWHFEIEPRKGRLHIQVMSGRKKSDMGNEELLVVKLTARGPIDSEEGSTLEEGLDIGHETIVCAFRDLTSLEARKYWGDPDADS